MTGNCCERHSVARSITLIHACGNRFLNHSLSTMLSIHIETICHPPVLSPILCSVYVLSMIITSRQILPWNAMCSKNLYPWLRCSIDAGTSMNVSIPVKWKNTCLGFGICQRKICHLRDYGTLSCTVILLWCCRLCCAKGTSLDPHSNSSKAPEAGRQDRSEWSTTAKLRRLCFVAAEVLSCDYDLYSVDPGSTWSRETCKLITSWCH